MTPTATTQPTNQSTAHPAARRQSAVPALLAALLGLAVIFVAGHVQSGALHGAAHDVRHSTGFPCH